MTDESKLSSSRANLSSKTARSVAWMMALKFSVQSLGIISTLILVRLLSPQDFGLVAMAMVFIAIMDMFTWFSFDVVLIQNQNAQRVQYDTAWTISVIFSTAASLILAAIAYPAALFYDEPRVTVLILILAGSFFISGFSNIGVVNFRKNLEFDKEFKLRFYKKMASFCVTVSCAFIFRNYWALIIGMVTGHIVGLVLSFTMESYRPRFSLRARHELMHFSKWLFLCNILYTMRMRGAELIVGRIGGAKTLGIFSISYEISNTPTTELVAPINRAVFPSYAKISSDMSAMRRGYLQVIALIALVVVPAGAGVAACAPILVPVVLGDKWLAATPLISILGFYGVISGLQTNIASVYLALAKPHILAGLHLLHLTVLMLFAIPATLKYGITGTAWSYLGVSLALLPVNYAVMFRTISLNPFTFLERLWRPLFATGVMYFAVRNLSEQLVEKANGAPSLADFGLVILSGMVVYALVETLCWLLSNCPEGAESYVFEQLRNRLKARSTKPK